MALATRVIPVLLHRGFALYKGVGFDAWRQVGVAQQAVQIHQARGVDELMVLDIDATKKRSRPNFRMIETLSSDCFAPLTVGGGIRTLADVKDALDAGADKVAVCSVALEEPTRLLDISDNYGNQALVVVIEVKNGKVTSHNGTQEWPISPENWAQTVTDMGAGEIVVSCVERDGAMGGYDLELISSIAESVNVPVIALGGCGTYEHMYQAVQAGASAVAAGAMFQFRDETPKGAAQYLAERGVEVRL